jgi:cytochrome c553
MTTRTRFTGSRIRASSLVVLLAIATSALAQPKAEVCLACHGANGASSTPLTPSLGGQPSFYVIAQLFLFREGRRDNEIMIEQAKGLTDNDLRSLSALVEKLPAPPPPKDEIDRARYQRGGAIVQTRHCTNCHGADFSGNKNVPRVANQREDYTLKALRDYRSGTRVGYGNAVMPETVSGLGDAELSDLAYFLAYLRLANR